ncbi:hypothetical protein P3L10_034102 [Capsicum annuum]|uniref:uncharacterized protein LOC107844631 n=1 Tax=Capsicum annuum TaxID=4072 RepID=UPI0007BFB974|nr:uncharacterized protein LOC107844631 [Capsicum annuum]
MGFKRYSELIAYLLVAEQHNELLMRNHESRPPDTALFPEVNATHFHQSRSERSLGPSRSCDRCRGRSHGHGRGRYFNQGDQFAINNDPQHQQCKKKGEAPEAAPRTNTENRCRYGVKGHSSRICRTPKHLVKLYQASLKKIDNGVEVNFIFEDNVKPMNLDASNFFTISEGYINYPVDDEYEIV